MKFIAIVGPDRLPHKTHEPCNPGFHQSAERCVEDGIPIIKNAYLDFESTRQLSSLGVLAAKTRTYLMANSTSNLDFI